MQGWIKLHRDILKWEWYDDINVNRLFIHLLIMANYEPRKWHGIVINPGQLVTSYQKLSAQCGLTTKQIRLAIDKLKYTNEVAIQSTNNYSIITITNWNKFQDEGKQKASGGQAEGSQRATTKEDKKERSKESIQHFDQFWELFPRQRRGDKAKAESAYWSALKKSTVEEIMIGLKSYIQSDEVAKGFAKGAAAWLNDSRWTVDYSFKPKIAIAPKLSNMERI